MLLYSLIFGIIAWIIPVAGLTIIRPIRSQFVVAGSLAACAASVMFQLFDIMRRVNAGDMAGIQDTIGAVTFGIGVMMMVTIAANVLYAALRKDSRNMNE